MSQHARTEQIEIDDETVARLARLAGLNIPEERLPLLTTRFRELHEMARDLHSLDLTGIELSSAYDPAWSEEAIS